MQTQLALPCKAAQLAISHYNVFLRVHLWLVVKPQWLGLASVLHAATHVM